MTSSITLTATGDPTGGAAALPCSDLKLRHSSDASTSSDASSASFSSGSSSAYSTQSSTASLSSRSPAPSASSSLDEGIYAACQEPNELTVDRQTQSTIAIEAPASTLRIDLGPFRPAADLQAEPGDILQFDRILSSHWAIYVGDGEVVHVVGTGAQEVPDSEVAIVQRATVEAVAGENVVRVNNKGLRAKERNLLPFNSEIVVRKAVSKVGSAVPYNVLQCNSEHYVTEWKYGQRWSDQAAMSLSSFGALRRQHTNSLSEGHALFVNTLNEVMNSPASVSAAASSSLSPSLSSPPMSITPRVKSGSTSTFALLCSTPPRRSFSGSPFTFHSTSQPLGLFTSAAGNGGAGRQYRQLSTDSAILLVGSLPKTGGTLVGTLAAGGRQGANKPAMHRSTSAFGF